MIINKKVTKVETVKETVSPVETYVSKTETVMVDGEYIQQVVRSRVDDESDVRNHFVANDYSLAAILANEGVGSLKDCRKLANDPFDDIDTIDNTLEGLTK